MRFLLNWRIWKFEIYVYLVITLTVFNPSLCNNGMWSKTWKWQIFQSSQTTALSWEDRRHESKIGIIEGILRIPMGSFYDADFWFMSLIVPAKSCHMAYWNEVFWGQTYSICLNIISHKDYSINFDINWYLPVHIHKYYRRARSCRKSNLLLS